MVRYIHTFPWRKSEPAKQGRTQVGSDRFHTILPFQPCRGTPCTSENTGCRPDFNRVVWNLVKNCLSPPRLTPFAGCREKKKRSTFVPVTVTEMSVMVPGVRASTYVATAVDVAL